MSVRRKTNDLDAFWMPFTANRQFKQAPRLFVGAEGMHYVTDDGRRVLDGTVGAVVRQRRALPAEDRRGDPPAGRRARLRRPSRWATRRRSSAPSQLVNIAPPGFDHVFFTNSGSESVDTALKIALAYHRAKGNGRQGAPHRPRARLSRRQLRRHFGRRHRRQPQDVRHARGAASIICATRTTCRATPSAAASPSTARSLPTIWSGSSTLHDASTIAAVIVEPVACSTGVLIPPKGYLKRLAAICAKHDILLIFDEVITAFGRLGAPFGADYFGVSPDIITTAKGITNGAVPMGAVFVKGSIHDALMTGPEEAIEFAHGYTYSGHPVACAACIATLDIYREEGLLTRAAELAPYWEEAVHSLKGLPHVIDIRNIGLIGAIELEPAPGRAGQARLCALPRGLQERASRARHGRYDRAGAAAHHREERDRRAHRRDEESSEVGRLKCKCAPPGFERRASFATPRRRP